MCPGQDDDSKKLKKPEDDLNEIGADIPGLSHTPASDSPDVEPQVGGLDFDFPTAEDLGTGHMIETTVSGVLGAAAVPEDMSKYSNSSAPVDLDELGAAAIELPETELQASENFETPAEPVITSETALPENIEPIAQPEDLSEPALDPMAPTRDFANQSSPAREAVPAAFPFSLIIEGHLTLEEREKLLSTLSRENMGISEADLEPQFEGERILIPRISEYAGVLLIQALRGSHASLRLGVSDSIYATDDTRDSATEAWADPLEASSRHQVLSHHAPNEAERIPMVASSALPGREVLEVIDTLVVSAALRSHVVEAQKSSEYHEVLEALKCELKYRAFRKGAEAIVNFSVQLDSLGSPGRFRLTVSGTAARGSLKTKL